MNNVQSNLAKGDMLTWKRNLANFVYHICYVAAGITKLVLCGAFRTHIGGGGGGEEVVGGQRW